MFYPGLHMRVKSLYRLADIAQPACLAIYCLRAVRWPYEYGCVKVKKKFVFQQPKKYRTGHFPGLLYVLTNQTDRENLTVHDPVAFRFRILEPTDGMALHRLVRACPPLDPNSSYCNLLQCSHFQSTSIAAIHDGELVGSITGYRIPDRADTLFIWQVAVHPSVRGQGLARAMLNHLQERLATQGVRFFETSITSGNEASLRLFTGFATGQNTDMLRSVMFEQRLHFEGEHETEYLFRIGPFKSASNLRASD